MGRRLPVLHWLDAQTRRRADLGPVDGAHRVPARLPGHLQPRGRGRARGRRLHRRIPQEPRHRRLHLREGPPVRRAGVRRRPPDPASRSPGPPRRRRVPGGHVGRGPRPDRGADDRDPRHRRGRGDPPLLVRRVQRPPHPGHRRRPAVPAVRRLPARPHRLRPADEHRQPGPLRQDAERDPRRLPPRPAHRGVGREPVQLRHPLRAAHQGRAGGGGGAGGRRSAPDEPGPARRHPSRGQAGNRRRRRAGHPPLPVRERSGRRGVSRRPRRGRGPAAGALRGMDLRPGGGGGGARPGADRELRGDVRRLLPRRHPLRLGARAQPQRGQRRPRGARPARRRRQVRGPRRRLLDEQHRRLEPLGRVVDRRPRAGHAGGQHEPPRAGPCSSCGTRRSGCCSSTTATRWRRCRTRTG